MLYLVTWYGKEPRALTFHRHFKRWIALGQEEDDSSRFLACIMVDDCIDSVDGLLSFGYGPEHFDHLGTAWVNLVSESVEKDCVAIGISYLIPRAFALLENLG